jgi:prepilin-type N-terminal cleavage/methylation domain-containing protein
MKRRSVHRPPPRHPFPPRAFTVVEMVVAISVIAMVMAVSATLFAAMSRSERNMLRSAAAQQTLGRVNELFRRDVHRSASVSLSRDPDQPSHLTLRQPNGTLVRYEAAAGKLERIVEDNGASHRELFRIPHATWSFEVSDENSGHVAISLERPADTITQVTQEFLPTRTWRLTAVLSLTLPGGSR